MRHARSNSGAVRLLTWVERVFVMGGVVVMTWCVFILTDAYVVQRIGRETLDRETTSSSTSRSSRSSGSTGARSSPARGTPLAELSIPRVGLSAVVLHGSDAHTLRLGLGHVENTPLPGESGNVAIAGHRDSFFRPLRKVQVGDDILLDTPEERVQYRVSSLRVVNSYEVSVIGPTKDATLTLVTCYPFWFIGQAPDRFVVRATRVEDPAARRARFDARLTRTPNRESVADGPPTGSKNGVTTRSAAGATRSSNKAGGIDSGAPNHVNRSIPSESITLAARGATDDDALVRKALERFRTTYNAGLTRHAKSVPDGLLTFRFCEVALVDTTATATCNAPSSSPEGLPSPVWTVGLDKTDGEWRVTAVATR
jgi:sortase A